MLFIAENLIEVYTDKIDRVNGTKLTNSNWKKQAQRYEYLRQFVRTLPEDFVIDCEYCSNKNNDEPNAGALLEIVMAYHYNKNPEAMEGTKSAGTFDLRMKNGRGIEIKLSLNGSCYNTPVTAPIRVYLANRDGVYIIEKSEINTVIEEYGKSGHLPYTAYETAKLHKGLSRALGYNVK
jgi:hypothetical protein